MVKMLINKGAQSDVPAKVVCLECSKPAHIMYICIPFCESGSLEYTLAIYSQCTIMSITIQSGGGAICNCSYFGMYKRTYNRC